MIYLDNAATTGKKPESVVKAVVNALTNYSVNPGRGSFSRSQKCSQIIIETRTKLKNMFNAETENCVIFTQNCTQAVNFVLKGVLEHGDGIIISSAEHNAVARPIFKLKEKGISVDFGEIIFDDVKATVRSFERQITDKTRIILCTHASNVTGQIMPIEQIGELCRKRGILFAVDAAQTAGIVPIDMQKMNIDFLFLAPHKGLYAPMGTGVLIARKPIKNTLIEGGTGTESMSLRQPADTPERFESGTVNVPGIFGISAGVDFINKKGMENIYRHELQLAKRFYNGLKTVRRAIVYTPEPQEGVVVPTISFNIRGITSIDVADYLAQNGIAVRAGLHCSPLIHGRIGTLDSGAVRVCFSAFNTVDEVDKTINVLKSLNNRTKNQKSG